MQTYSDAVCRIVLAIMSDKSGIFSTKTDIEAVRLAVAAGLCRFADARDGSAKMHEADNFGVTTGIVLTRAGKELAQQLACPRLGFAGGVGQS